MEKKNKIKTELSYDKTGANLFNGRVVIISKSLKNNFQYSDQFQLKMFTLKKMSRKKLTLVNTIVKMQRLHIKSLIIHGTNKIGQTVKKKEVFISI